MLLLEKMTISIKWLNNKCYIKNVYFNDYILYILCTVYYIDYKNGGGGGVPELECLENVYRFQ